MQQDTESLSFIIVVPVIVNDSSFTSSASVSNNDLTRVFPTYLHSEVEGYPT